MVYTSSENSRAKNQNNVWNRFTLLDKHRTLSLGLHVVFSA